MWIVWLMAFVVLPIMGVAYASWHIWAVLPLSTAWRWGAVGAFVAAVILMFMNFMGICERIPLGLAKAVYEIGNSVIVVLLYLVLLFAVLDLCSLMGIVPKAWLHDNGYMAAGLLCVMVAVLGYGYWHYTDKYRQELELVTAKNVSDAAGVKEKKIVFMSDLHLGYHIDRKEFAKWVDMINAEHPDLIVIGGDIIDVSVRPLIEEGMAQEFHRFAAPVCACLGNHEYYAKEPNAQRFYEAAGVTLLRDSVVTIDGVTVIGRDDRTNEHRKPLAELIKHVDTRNYTILLDHQPYHLEEAEKAGVDFQFSGHTHDGQVWPASWLTRLMFEKSFGYTKKGGTEYYISSGIGIWGPKFRLGTRSEYVVATLRQK